MADGQYGVVVKYAWAGVTHDDPDAIAHVRLVAVHRASGTGGLVCLERAARQAGARVSQDLLAIGAQLPFLDARLPVAAMLCAAVQADHRFEGMYFARHARVVKGHG